MEGPGVLRPHRGLLALEQILVRCILHSHRQKLWEPRHRRSLLQTAARHDGILALLAARDGQGLAKALGEHIDTIVEVDRIGEGSRTNTVQIKENVREELRAMDPDLMGDADLQTRVAAE